MTDTVTLPNIHIPTEREITATFATRVRAGREENNWSLRDFAEVAHISHTMAWAVEGANRHVSLVNAFRMSLALKTSLTDLLTPVPCKVCLGRPQPGMTCNICRRSTALA